MSERYVVNRNILKNWYHYMNLEKRDAVYRGVKLQGVYVALDGVGFDSYGTVRTLYKDDYGLYFMVSHKRYRYNILKSWTYPEDIRYYQALCFIDGVLVEIPDIEVSICGKFRNGNSRRPLIAKGEYARVWSCLLGKSLLKHRVMASTFLENVNPLVYSYVNHLDGSKANFELSNLEWATPEVNMAHSMLLPNNRGLLKKETVDLIRKLDVNVLLENISKLAKRYSKSERVIRDVYYGIVYTYDFVEEERKKLAYKEEVGITMMDPQIARSVRKLQERGVTWEGVRDEYFPFMTEALFKLIVNYRKYKED